MNLATLPQTSGGVAVATVFWRKKSQASLDPGALGEGTLAASTVEMPHHHCEAAALGTRQVCVSW